MKYLTLVVIISIGFLINGCSSKSNGYTTSKKIEPYWIKDQNGCKKWNPEPVPHETITWTGKCVNGFIDGYGTLQWYKDSIVGNKYIGNIINSRYSGQGTQTLSNGDKYVGEWKEGKKHGQGTYFYSNGDKYVGELKEDKNHGQGTYFYSNGDKYVGEWKEDKKHGQGTYTWGVYNKNCKAKYCDKKFVGKYVNDYISYGKLTFYNTDKVYEGKFTSQGKRLTDPTYSKFVKDQNGCLHERPFNIDMKVNWTGQCKGGYADSYGKETFRYSNNKKISIYEGTLKDGKKDGEGTYLNYTSSRSSSFLGGDIVACDVHIGTWKNGEKDGKGRYEHHYGQSCNSKLDYSYDGNSLSLEGYWHEGYMDGEYIEQIFGSKTLYKKIYKDGKFVNSYRINGNILSDISHAIGRAVENSASSSSAKGYEVKSKTKYYKKITTDGKYRKIHIRCNNGKSNYVEESYDYYNGSTKHYFKANAGAVWQPTKYDNFNESANELCEKHR